MLLAALLVTSALSASFTVNLSSSTTVLRHVWENCVGSGHAHLGTQENWRTQLQLQRTTVGWQQVRFHGLLDDDMSAFLNGKGNFALIDYVFDFLRDIGMRPLVEISFMPEEMATGTATVFHYKGNITPPKSWSKWEDFITTLARHWLDRYGADYVTQWKFEVWNEPNCGFYDSKPCCGATGCGNQTAYFELYNHTAHALRRASPMLQVGGPATAQVGWFKEFITYVKTNRVPVDFISSHLYPTDPEVPSTRTGFEDLLATRAKEAEGEGLPLLITEYNSGLGINQADYAYSAAFVVHEALAMQSIPNIKTFSYWTFSDIFEEGGYDSAPFGQKFGVMTIRGVAKPVLRAFEMLRNLTSESVIATTQGNVDIIGTIGAGKFRGVVTNFQRWDIPSHPEVVNITFTGFPADAQLPSHADVQLIDSTHCNPRAVWEGQGSPEYPTAVQVADYMVAAELKVSPNVLTVVGNTRVLTLLLEPSAVASIEFDF